MKQITLKNNQLRFQACRYGGEKQDAELVLCLHGFPDNLNSFRHQVDDLLTAGYQVMCVAMRGYEPASVPADHDFSVTSMAADVLAWLDQLGIRRVHLVGHDWGAAVAYMTAAQAPHRLFSLTTMAVPHPQRFSRVGLRNVPSQALKSWYMLFNQLPGLSDYVVTRNNFGFLRFLWRRWSPGLVMSERQWQDLVATYAQPGVVKAMLSYYRQNVSPGQLLGIKNSSLSTPFKVPVPNLAITGADDGCIDSRVFDYTILPEDHPRGFRLERIAGAGHFVHQEKPEIINKLLVDWFQANHQND